MGHSLDHHGFQGKIDATKLDVRTLAVLIASRLSVTSSPGTQWLVNQTVVDGSSEDLWEEGWTRIFGASFV